MRRGNDFEGEAEINWKENDRGLLQDSVTAFNWNNSQKKDPMILHKLHPVLIRRALLLSTTSRLKLQMYSLLIVTSLDSWRWYFVKTIA
jgi:hypothetical protein